MGNQIKKRKTKSRMADAAPALSQATIDMINTRVTAQFAEWKQTGTPEQKAAGAEKLRRMREGPEFMAEQMGKFGKMFNDADTNGDGRLNLEEYKVFNAAAKPMLSQAMIGPKLATMMTPTTLSLTRSARRTASPWLRCSKLWDHGPKMTELKNA